MPDHQSDEKYAKKKTEDILRSCSVGTTVKFGLGLPVSDQKLAVAHCKIFGKKNPHAFS